MKNYAENKVWLKRNTYVKTILLRKRTIVVKYNHFEEGWFVIQIRFVKWEKN